MELKEYQEKALDRVKAYLELLSEWRKKAEAMPEAEINFPERAWEKAQVGRPYRSRKNGLGEHLPNFCLKIPTGGGKTLLAAKSIDLIQAHYLKRRTGLVLWVVPTNQIYRQTINNLKSREHPYRQVLDVASGGRTVILEKSDRFTPEDIRENLIVLMLMLPSASRQNKETLKMFRDSGGFQSFFPAEDDVEGNKKLLARFKNLDTFGADNNFWGRQIMTSLGNTLRLLSPIIILDEGHKAYSETAQSTLRGFNPSIIVELSATPVAESNKLIDILGVELNREEMIKLDLHIFNKASPDWKDTVLASVNHRNLIEKKARDYEGNSGYFIRPICLIQVERTGKDQRDSGHIHSEEVREHLIKVLGIPSEQVAVKTSEKDELKEVDDVGGLMSPNCEIRYIITKQALQEGWDCAFAYVLTILTDPTSQNALTQLVGRILRQPLAKKTNVKELDESYVFCFQQKAKGLLESIRQGFEKEGLGDLSGRVVSDGGAEAGDIGKERISKMREKFRKTAAQIILPLFVVKSEEGWRALQYDMDIASAIPWDEVNLKPLFSLTLSSMEEKDREHIATLSGDKKEPLEQREVRQLKEGALKLDATFVTRHLNDIVPNPWIAHEISQSVLSRLLKNNDDKLVANNAVFIIEEMRRHLAVEKDRLAESIFMGMLKKDRLRFMVIGQDLGYRFPKQISVKAGTRTLTRSDGQPLQMSLFDFCAEDGLNESEKMVAWYLEEHQKLFFWNRNIARQDYYVQGWKKHRIYPDFVFTSTGGEDRKVPFDNIFVVETKGIHLKNEDTAYKEQIFDLCEKQAETRSWSELGLAFKDKKILYKVVHQDEWQRKLNEFFS